MYELLVHITISNLAALFGKMAKVNICDVTVLDNPSPFKNPFQFEITFECLEDLKDGKGIHWY